MIPVIIIAAYNPPITFNQLIQSILDSTSIPIIVVDDCSHPIIKIETEHPYLNLLINAINRGKGFSLLKGFHYAKKCGYTHAITMDADSQHDPLCISQFASFDENVSILCGKRDFRRPMPIHRRFSNIITSKILSSICKKTLLDSQCGYRRYNLQDVCNQTFIEKGFQFETEVLIKLIRNNKIISHINVPTIYNGEDSTINILNDTITFFILILRSLRK